MSESKGRSRWELRLTLFFAGLLIGIAGAVFAFTSQPKLYRAAATIQIKTRAILGPITSEELVTVQKRIIRSGAVLSPVVRELRLSEKWKMDAGRCINHLEKQTTVREIRNTELMQISVWDPSPQQAADLANAIAESYQSRCVEEDREMSGRAFDQLEAEVKQQRQKVEWLKARGSEDPEFINARRVLVAVEERLSTENAQHAKLGPSVVFWEWADVPTAPSSPQMAVFVLAGLLTGVVIGAILAVLVRPKIN